MDGTGGKRWSDGFRPYVEKAPLAALALGMSSGFPYAMIGATLTTRLAQDGIDKKTVTAFSLAFLVYNLKFLWAWVVDGVRLPVIGRLGQRVSWLIVTGVLVIAAVVNLALVDPHGEHRRDRDRGDPGRRGGRDLRHRHRRLSDRDRSSRASSASARACRNMAGGSDRRAPARWRWWSRRASAGARPISPAPCFALPAMLTGLVARRARAPARADRTARPRARAFDAIWGPFVEFFAREGAFLVLLFILIHKIGDTLANLTLRLLFDDLGFTNDEIAFYDVGVGFWAYLIGIFVGGVLYARLGMKRSVLLGAGADGGVEPVASPALAAAGHSQPRHGGRDRLREFRQRHRRRRRGRLFLGAVRPALHRRAVCADLGGGEHRRPVRDRHHRRRADRGDRLCRTSTC